MLSKKLQVAHQAMQKQREEFLKLPVFGTRLKINGVNCILHEPKTEQKDLPLFIELHGGAWVAGDAALVDSLCKKISDNVPCVCVNVNYTKLDCKPFPFAQNEVIKVCEHFAENASKYGINKNKIVICGQSAGAHIAAGATVLMKDSTVRPALSILCYPFLDFSGKFPNPLRNAENEDEFKEIDDMFFDGGDPCAPYLSPLTTDDENLRGISKTLIITCEKDVLKPHGKEYFKKLSDIGAEVCYKEFEGAEHGFLEVNRDDYFMENDAKGETQKKLCVLCEDYIIDAVKSL